MLSAEASIVVMLILCAYEKPTNAAIKGESTSAVTLDAKAKNTSRESSETSVTAEGTQEKNQTSPRDTPTKPIPTSQKPFNEKKQAKSPKIKATENNVDGKDPSKVKANVSKSKSAGNSFNEHTDF